MQKVLKTFKVRNAVPVLCRYEGAMLFLFQRLTLRKYGTPACRQYPPCPVTIVVAPSQLFRSRVRSVPKQTQMNVWNLRLRVSEWRFFVSRVFGKL